MWQKHVTVIISQYVPFGNLVGFSLGPDLTISLSLARLSPNFIHRKINLSNPNLHVILLTDFFFVTAAIISDISLQDTQEYRSRESGSEL